jgi:hypothetical protein
MTKAWIYVDTSKVVGDPDHLKVFANGDAADAWLAENNDPEKVSPLSTMCRMGHRSFATLSPQEQTSPTGPVRFEKQATLKRDARDWRQRRLLVTTANAQTNYPFDLL